MLILGFINTNTNTTGFYCFSVICCQTSVCVVLSSNCQSSLLCPLLFGEYVMVFFLTGSMPYLWSTTWHVQVLKISLYHTWHSFTSCVNGESNTRGEEFEIHCCCWWGMKQVPILAVVVSSVSASSMLSFTERLYQSINSLMVFSFQSPRCTRLVRAWHQTIFSMTLLQQSTFIQDLLYVTCRTFASLFPSLIIVCHKRSNYRKRS